MTLKSLTKNFTYVSPDFEKEFPRPKKISPVEFVTFGKFMTNQEVRDGLKTKGLVPASPWDVLVWCTKHDKEWKEKKYLACITDSDLYAAFSRWDGGRSVDVGRDGFDWGGYWWIGGVRESSDTQTLSPSESLVTLPEILTINGVTYRKL